MKHPARLELEFTCNQQRTRLTQIRQEPPWKVVRAFANADGGALVHVHNVSGGVLAGDRLHAEIRLGAGAHAQITSAGSTRIYRSSAQGTPATQEVSANVGPNALLEYLPDSLIPFAGSDYRQSTTIRLESGAGLFWWDIVAPGRTREAFHYRRLEFENAVWSAGEPIFRERSVLAPSTAVLPRLIGYGGYTHLATLLACRSEVRADQWSELERELGERIARMNSPLELWGISTLRRDGLVMRGLGFETEPLSRTLITFWRRLKVALYGAEPILPRKIY